MNDQPAAPFSPFSPSPPPTPTPTSPPGGQMFDPAGVGQGKKPRKKRAKKAAPQLPAGRQVKPRKAKKDRHNLAEQVATFGADSLLPPEKTARKRKARKPQALKIDPMIVFEAAIGLNLGDVAGIARIMEEMQKFPKKSRAKIVAALGKVFT